MYARTRISRDVLLDVSFFTPPACKHDVVREKTRIVPRYAGYSYREAALLLRLASPPASLLFVRFALHLPFDVDHGKDAFRISE